MDETVTAHLPPLLICADANARMGAGHVMRCLALAQAWHVRGGPVTFLSVCESEDLRQRITAAGCALLSLEPGQTGQHGVRTLLATLEQCATRMSSSVPWVVLDGYHFDATYQRAIRTAGYRLLVIDDIAHLPQYHADVLLNQNIGATTLPYHCDADTSLLLGPHYALLRPEFLAWRGWHREIPDVARKVLVTMGGSDPDNVTLQVVHALQKVDIDGLEVAVVLGANYAHALPTFEHANLQAFTVVRNALNMPTLMAWADIAVSAGGSTCWELLFMGLPSLLLIVAENQVGNATHLAEIGVAINIGLLTDARHERLSHVLDEIVHDPARRAAMGQEGRQLVDGQGSARVTQTLSRGHYA